MELLPPTAKCSQICVEFDVDRRMSRIADRFIMYGLLGSTDFNMPVNYKKDIFDIYTEALHYFRESRLLGLSEP